MAAQVYLIGAGPGDPELLTVKAQRILQSAEVVLYDRLVSPEVLAVANAAAELLYAGKGVGEQDEVQQWIVDRMLEYARRGRIVVRLKGGDPCVFGRGAEEWLILREQGIEVEMVPGLSSAIAAPGIAGIPVTHRGVSHGFAVVTGHCRGDEGTDWARYAAVDTLVILMGVSGRARIARALMAAGRGAGEPVAFIERGSTPGQRIIVATLGEVAEGQVEVESPAVFVAGEVVRVRERLLDCACAASAFAC
jgi:uroporphyrin-III C-methyltransferase